MDASQVSGSPAPVSRMRFRWPWRPYQRRVLEALDRHVADRRLHIVAAPGSGKTCLGLEVFRRLERPAVVLSPTRTIRDQWLKRLSDFLPEDTIAPSWTSTDIDAPGYLTSLTYQALHTRTRDRGSATPDDTDNEAAEEDEDENGAPSESELSGVVERLREARVGTLIFDEAHHLQAAWWRALSRLVEALGDVTLVSLTATPPYDVVRSQWQRYETLCGPIDEEISVPELVRSGTLCPHQDFVHAVHLARAERETLLRHEEAVVRLLVELECHAPLWDSIAGHPWLGAQAPDPSDVLETPELAAALASFVRARGGKPPRPLLALLGCRERELPAMDRRWWQVLVYHYLFGDTWRASSEREADRAELARRLREAGLLHRRELRIEASRPITALLSASQAKLNGCVEICELEAAHRGNDLRQVILTDFIGEGEDDRLAAWPIFRQLARVPGLADARIALLTGRVAALHRSSLPSAERAAAKRGHALSVESFPGLDGWHRVSLTGRASALVPVFTDLLDEGEIRVVVGTRALLGEGWDSPVVNSVVVASYVGAFVATNQMRGRAIRRNPENPTKVASIWHLVALDPTTPAGLADWRELARRFDTFVGLAAHRPAIESGLERLGLPDPRSPGALDALNRATRQQYHGHAEVGAAWQAAIEIGRHGRVAPGAEARGATRRPGLFVSRTFGHLVAIALELGVVGFFSVFRSPQTLTRLDAPALGVLAALTGFVVSASALGRVLRVWLRKLPVDGQLEAIASALRDALAANGQITDAPPVRVERIRPGVYFASITTGSFHERSLFADCLEEILAPIENPRYLVTRGGRWAGWGSRQDMHAVPTPLATHKALATSFHDHWNQRVGGSKLVYTRTAEGRIALLRARARAFSSEFVEDTRRLDRWQ